MYWFLYDRELRHEGVKSSETCFKCTPDNINCLFHSVNLFVPNAPFFYPLKTSGNLTVFLCFQWLEKGCIGNEWVNQKMENRISLKKQKEAFWSLCLRDLMI